MLIECCLKKPNVIHGSEIQDCHLHLCLTIDPIGKWIAAFSLKQQIDWTQNVHESFEIDIQDGHHQLLT
jgi:hypothetical protein